MPKRYLTLAILAASLGPAEAAECTATLQNRWASAMAEAMQIQRILVGMKKEPEGPLLCRIVSNASELSYAGKEYFPACDPLGEPRGRLLVLKIEEALAKSDISQCKPAKAGPGKKT